MSSCLWYSGSQVACEPCSAVCKECPETEDGKELHFLWLKIGFWGLDVRYHWAETRLLTTDTCSGLFPTAGVTNSPRISSVLAPRVAPLTHRTNRSTWKQNVSLASATGSLSPRRCDGSSHAPSGLLVSSDSSELGWRNSPLLDRPGVGVDDVDSKEGWLQLLLFAIESREGTHSLP
jgi:hypothetical protein